MSQRMNLYDNFDITTIKVEIGSGILDDVLGHKPKIQNQSPTWCKYSNTRQSLITQIRRSSHVSFPVFFPLDGYSKPNFTGKEIAA